METSPLASSPSRMALLGTAQSPAGCSDAPLYETLGQGRTLSSSCGGSFGDWHSLVGVIALTQTARVCSVSSLQAQGQLSTDRVQDSSAGPSQVSLSAHLPPSEPSPNLTDLWVSRLQGPFRRSHDLGQVSLLESASQSPASVSLLELCFSPAPVPSPCSFHAEREGREGLEMGVGTWGGGGSSDSRMPLLRTAQCGRPIQGHLRCPLTIPVRKLDWGEEAIGNLPKKPGTIEIKGVLIHDLETHRPALYTLTPSDMNTVPGQKPSPPSPSPAPTPPTQPRRGGPLPPVAPTLDEAGRNQPLEQRGNLQVTFPLLRTQRQPR